MADMSLDVIWKWRPSLHIYSEKWREDGGGKRWKAREENRRERGGPILVGPFLPRFKGKGAN